MIKNAYSIDKKLKVIDIAINNGVKYASRTTKIHQSCIYKWVRDKTRFESIKNKTKVRRIGAGGRTILSEEEELGVRDWILSRNEKDLLVNFQTAQRHCKVKTEHTSCKENKPTVHSLPDGLVLLTTVRFLWLGGCLISSP